MLIKLDENLAATLCRLLEAQGHRCTTVLQQGLGGMPDDDIARICLAEGRVLVTLDRRFADVRRHPPGTHFGIAVLRLPDQTAPAVERAVSRLGRLLNQQDIAGHLWIIDEARVRIR